MVSCMKPAPAAQLQRTSSTSIVPGWRSAHAAAHANRRALFRSIPAASLPPAKAEQRTNQAADASASSARCSSGMVPAGAALAALVMVLMPPTICMPTAAAAAAPPLVAITNETPVLLPQRHQRFARPCYTPSPTTAAHSSINGSIMPVANLQGTQVVDSSTSPNCPNTAPPAAVEIPPIAPFTPAPSTPPNSPLPTPHVPHPPLLPTPPPPAIPPQLLPPCPGNQPPPQKLIPNAPAANSAPMRPATCSSATGGSCSTGGAAAEEMFEDVLAGSSSSSSSNGGLLRLFRQQQGLQQRWQQALLHAAFADGAASQLASQEPPALPLPDGIPTHSFSLFEGAADSPARPFSGGAGASWRSSGGSSSSGSSSFSSLRAMLATYAVADTAAVQAADMSTGNVPSAGNVPSVLTADDAGSATAASKSKKGSLKSSSSSSSSSTSAATQDTTPAPAKAAVTGSPTKETATGSVPSPANGTIEGLQQQYQGLQAAAKRDPGVSDFLKAAARFAEAVVRVGLIILRVLVQVTAVLLQAAVKLLVWLLDWAGQESANRVAAVRQQNIARLGGQALVQQEGEGKDVAVGYRVAMAAAAEQQAPELHARAV